MSRKTDEEDYKAIKKHEKDGVVTAEDLVRAAKRETHPLHNRFEWDNEKAGHLHRIEVAREIIRRVSVHIVKDEIVTYRPAWVRNPAPLAPAGYVETKAIASQPVIAMQVINAEVVRIKGCVERARGLSAEFGLREEFETLLTNVVKIERMLRLAA